MLTIETKNSKSGGLWQRHLMLKHMNLKLWEMETLGSDQALIKSLYRSTPCGHKHAHITNNHVHMYFQFRIHSMLNKPV